MSFDVPILLCVFNRPELTSHVFESIARQKPKRLLIAGDGPRAGNSSDKLLVERVQSIVYNIDWDCEVQMRFSKNNYGCRQQMARAITWGFEQYEQLIILEDDCLPNDSFFTFCQQMLERYQDDPQVMAVSGNNYLTSGNDHSYRFSKYPLIWGWASWRRAWQLYDLNMPLWSNPEVRKRVLDNYTDSPEERNYWERIFSNQRAGEINTWDYSWTFSCWANDGLTILPKHNLVSNIGFGDSATHTFDQQSPMANRTTYPLVVDNHPNKIMVDRVADQQIKSIVFEPKPKQIVPVPPRKSLMARLLNLSSPRLSRSKARVLPTQN